MIRRLAIPLLLVASLVLIYHLVASRAHRKMVDLRKPLMGSVVQIKVPIPPEQDETQVRSAISKAFGEMKRIESVFSIFKEDSEISRINRFKYGERLVISDEVFDLIESSIDYNKKTRGAFDITVKPLVALWNRAKAENRIPEEFEIRSALAKIGSRDIILDRTNRTISFAKEGMALDMGGIVQGYATDRAIKVLRENGVRNAIVNVSGDMYCLGRRSESDLWMVGVQHPRRKDELYFEIKLEDKAVVTSGDYEKFFILGDRRYSHIIDPRTGYPVGDNIVSATVITRDSTTADALATALCVVGKDGLDIINSIDGVDAILIIKEGDELKTAMSEGLKARYEIIERKDDR